MAFLYKDLTEFILRKLHIKSTDKDNQLSLPVTLMIEPTNVCNLKCPTCPTGSGKMNRAKRMMSIDEFNGIINQVKGFVHNIVLWNYGEPFLNKDLLNMINYAVRNNIHVVTSTNGEFFKSKKFCLKIVKSGLQHLIICLDGADQETISKFRKGSHFERIIQGMRLMIEAKKNLNSELPKIELQFIVMKHNEHQKDLMKHMAAQFGVDVFCEKTVGIDCRDPEFENMAKELLPHDLSNSRYVLNEDGTYALKGLITNKCSWVNNTAVINSDGTIVPCCYDLYSEYIMGSIFEKSLGEIWENRKYTDFRKRIKENRKDIPICTICSEHRYSITKRTH